ncbi:hypothetical protein BST33_04950 [Mycolicibacter minnesotensis]|uniref:Uncharacterized protein n=1 Tax=Mycolicibacter minnesotensis TaxID=1118379 RepID=A0A7I7RAM4_9MYCO|nr:hypothetical protein [Mycolicibacter minnesotensis]ORB03283.1 hypothetical protein BST33_04950 [Mycolicibacter minnesotensis]BBY35718.1 hypothetical protein MMIN_37790 [Mycolicibacter minnesotensis]
MAIVDRSRRHVAIAGVPWPTYKVVALALGILTLLAVGAVTSSAATAVLTAAGVCTAAWLVLGVLGD